MSSIRTIKRRIKSIKNINDITKAMEMISAVRFKRVESRYRRSTPYIESLRELISRIVSEEAVKGHPLFEKRRGTKELLVVFTGDRGLCGSFNTNLLRRAEQYLRENPGREIGIVAVGKIGIGHAKRRLWRLEDSLSDMGYKFTPASLEPVTQKLVQAYVSGRYDRVSMLSMEISKGGVQKPVLEPFLNLEYLSGERAPKDEMDYIFEPDLKTTLEKLVELYVKQKVFSTFLRSVTAEYNARMIAMKLATDNGKELIKELTLERNKIRQAMITKEISEIIGGVNALS